MKPNYSPLIFRLLNMETRRRIRAEYIEGFVLGMLAGAILTVAIRGW